MSGYPGNKPAVAAVRGGRVVACFAIASALFLLVLVFTGCGGRPTTSSLAGVEVREYQGQKLSSVTAFRENSIKGPQHVDISTYHLKISGLVDKPLSFSYDDVIGKNQLYTKVVTLDCVEGWSVTILWEGVLVKDLLNQAGVKPEARTAIFKCYDGYTTSVDLAYLLANDILLGYKQNGLVLPPERGYPFQLVAEQKWGYKWAKWVTEIELSSDVNYQGYWEKFGYSRDGSTNRPFFGN